MKKTTWDDVRAGRTERREYRIVARRTVDNGRGWLQRTYETIECPFCASLVTALTRSLNGVGKRCTQCGAMHDGIGCAYRISSSIMSHEDVRTDDHRIMFVDFKTVTIPTSGQLFENYHWVVHREHGVAFVTKLGSTKLEPLCDRHSIKLINKAPPCLNGEYDPLGLEVRKIPVVYLGHEVDLLSRLSTGGGPA